MKKFLMLITAMVIGLLTTGCGTFELQTSAKMTKSVFLKELDAKKTIYLVTTNTTGTESTFRSKIEADLTERGYELTTSPDGAKYILRVNLVNNIAIRQQNESKAAGAMAVTGAVVAGVATKSLKSGLVTGVAMGAAGALFAYATADGNVRMQADIMIEEKFPDKPSETFTTRVISEARQVHLKPKEGQVILEGVMSKKIAGIFL